MGSRNVNVAVLGSGRWGRNVVRTFFELGALGAVVDPDPAAQRVAAALAPGVPLHADADAILADPTIGAVAIATPASTHAALCEAAIAAGKDVLCEKPLALSLADAERVAAAGALRGRVVGVGHLAEYQPGVRHLASMTASGALGRLRFLHARRTSFGRIRRDENVLWSLAPHDVAVILRLVGELPSRVTAGGSAHVRPGVHDVASVDLQFPSGASALVLVSWLCPVKERRLVVVGAERSASFDEIAGTLAIHNSRVIVDGGEAVLDGDPSAAEVPLRRCEPLRDQCADFLRAIADRDAPLTDLPSALAVVRVLDAAQRSLASGGAPVHLGPDRG